MDCWRIEHPDQSIIDRAVAEDHPPERRDDIMLHLRKISYSFLQVMNRLEVNVLIAPADTYFAKYGAATGSYRPATFHNQQMDSK
mgnify:CR=1 FL=1